MTHPIKDCFFSHKGTCVFCGRENPDSKARVDTTEINPNFGKDTMYDLGFEHGYNIALKDVKLKKLNKELEKLK